MADRKKREEKDEIRVEETPKEKAEVKIEPSEPDYGEPVAWGKGGQFIKRNGKLYRA